MRSVAIVGLGWFGLSLARDLRNLGWEVKGSKRTHEGADEMRLRRLETYRLELTPEINADPDDLTALLSAGSLVINIPPSDYFFEPESYEKGIENLVQEALLCGVSHFIFISSTSVFGDDTGMLDESCEPHPKTPAANALFQVERMLRHLRQIDVDILRFGGLIGADRHPVRSMSGLHLKQGNTPVNLVHSEDCSRAVQLLLETPGGCRLYHLTAPYHPSRAQYYTAAAEQFHIEPPHFICSEDDPNRVICGDKICTDLDFVYQYPNL